MKLFALVLGSLAITLVVGGAALADSTYTDATGDAPSGLDITTINVSNNPNQGTVTFTVTLANAPTLTDQQEVDIIIDGDRNAGTGDPTLNGADYVFTLGSGGYDFQKWDATTSAWVDTGTDFPVTYGNGVLTWTPTAVDLGSSPAFNFLVVTATANPADANSPFLDLAPDSGEYTYTLTQAAPAAPTITSTAATVAGSGKAGTTYVVKSLAVDLSNGTTVNATKLKCSATLGGVAFKGTGAGGCTFKLPKKSKGKRLVVRITGTYRAAKVASTESFKVR